MNVHTMARSLQLNSQEVIVGAGIVGLLGAAAYVWYCHSKTPSAEPCDAPFGCTDSEMVALMEAAEKNTTAALDSFRKLVEAAKLFEAGAATAPSSRSIQETCILGRERFIAILEQLSAIAGPTVTDEMRQARKALVISVIAVIGDDPAPGTGTEDWTLSRISHLVNNKP